MTPVINENGDIYLAADNILYALDSSGNELWSFYSNDRIWVTPIITKDGNLFFGSDDGFLYSLDKAGRLNWMIQHNSTMWTGINVDQDGNACFGTLDGSVYSINLGSPLANSPWPMWGRDPALTGQYREFIMESEPPVIQQVRYSEETGFTFTFSSQKEQTYTIFGSTDLVTWESLGEVKATGQLTEFSNPAPLDKVRRFFRLGILE